VAILTGVGLAPGIQGSVVPAILGALPTQVASVTVQFGGVLAPIYNVSNTEGQESVTFEVPCETQPGSIPVTVTVAGNATSIETQVQAAAPGIFETTMSDDRRRAMVQRPDGTFASLENPAQAGEVVRVFTTGLGAVTPAIGTNQRGALDKDASVTDSVSAQVAGAGVRVVSAKYFADLIGVYVVDVELPAGVATGDDVPLTVAVREQLSNVSAIPIR
jgi:uncharacterized protein (TIGR03437 family)